MTSWNNQNKSSAATWSVEAKNASSWSFKNKGDDTVSLYNDDVVYDFDKAYDGFILQTWSYQNKN